MGEWWVSLCVYVCVCVCIKTSPKTFNMFIPMASKLTELSSWTLLKWHTGWKTWTPVFICRHLPMSRKRILNMELTQWCLIGSRKAQVPGWVGLKQRQCLNVWICCSASLSAERLCRSPEPWYIQSHPPVTEFALVFLITLHVPLTLD